MTRIYHKYSICIVLTSKGFLTNVYIPGNRSLNYCVNDRVLISSKKVKAVSVNKYMPYIITD